MLLLMLAIFVADKPITTDGGAIGKLLKKWHAEGTTAGNVGDWYDNRDGEHSPLDLKPWPQLQKVKYSEEDFKLRRNWALQPRVLPHVVFGNSSTSAPPTSGGSNPMQYYTRRGGLDFLEKHYRGNNVYIYPEHRDHDPGHNGIGGGYGDLYPTNSPYLIISQGSSGSDQPFMRALPFTLAALRPDVKKFLVEKGLLMPTLQRIFRASNKNVKTSDDYFTGMAHPTVFEGSNVDPLKMVNMAHAITRETIPPLVQLKVLTEDEPKNGVDFFELAWLSEKLHTTPTVIARVWRGRSGTRRMKLSAKGSVGVSGNPLSFKWVLLRGDPRRVTIEARGAEATINVQYHERRPIAPGSAMESNRVDIGVFALDGKAVSAPAFITWFSLDSEKRQGNRILHGVGTTEATVTDWGKMLAALPELAFLAREATTLQSTLTETRKNAQAEKDPSQRKALNEQLKRSQMALDVFLDKSREKLKGSARVSVQRQLEKMLSDRRLAARTKSTPRIEAARKKMQVLGEAFLGELNGAILADALFPGAVRATFRPNWVDPRLETPRVWADAWDAGGGWVRTQLGRGEARFTPEGWLVTRTDKKNRPVQARTVVYRQGRPARGSRVFNLSPLNWAAGTDLITFGYEDGKRMIKTREKVLETVP